MSTEWYTREYELYTLEYELHTREYELYTREYWIKVNLVLVPTSDSNARLPHFVSSREQNLFKYATRAIFMIDFPWEIMDSR
jgi:hypothetical protein